MNICTVLAVLAMVGIIASLFLIAWGIVWLIGKTTPKPKPQMQYRHWLL